MINTSSSYTRFIVNKDKNIALLTYIKPVTQQIYNKTGVIKLIYARYRYILKLKNLQ